MTTGLLPELLLQHQNQTIVDWVSRGLGTAIRALFKHSERLEVRVRVEPVAKLLQGRIDSFELLGQHLQMYNGLRLSLLELFSNSVAIDFSQIWQRRVRLRQPVQATMRVVLTEADLAASFNTPFVLNRLAQMKLGGQPLSFQQVQIRITPDRRLQLQAKVQQEAENALEVGFSSRIEVLDRRRIRFEDPVFEGHGDGLVLSRALVEHLNALLDLDRLALQGTELRVDRVRLQPQQMIFYGSATIECFPARQPQLAGA
ncbi:MAG: LmeA family phospholipid-binding protein [Cyanobacteriota bacterium]